MEYLIVYLIFIVLGVLFTVAIMRAVFMIPTIVDNLRAQTKHLNEIKQNQKDLLAALNTGHLVKKAADSDV
ncbi:hypothetical protein [Mucilaginibacter ginkgonis]|uniref:Uncharacterized protein n=1 Tax=Mucilaginibacter ginkgonis TaxID=2682091 RepID=A0A6I4INP4_9SPHI|nr:hypothetical protein [Mucilaginibacter ginkgonis]QQL48952.1 hypothetical protein GO620_012285 [Mucilaginibacter ginkgonis]